MNLERGIIQEWANNVDGKIIKGIGGFYYIKPFDSSFLSQEVIECKPRGKMRFKQIKPTVGDRVRLEKETNGDYSIVEIYDRENILTRPPVSNVDLALICISTEEPTPNLFILDKLLANAIYNNIQPIICIMKTDLNPARASELSELYKKAGFKVLEFSNQDGDDLEQLLECISDKTSFFTGPSGVGKSTLANRFSPVKMETGETSVKTKRGKHTTRHVELIEIDPSTFILDTPGFSSLELDEKIQKEELKTCYPEFQEYSCRFSNCNHIKEPGCGVREAVREQRIDKERYKRYVELFEVLGKRTPY